MWPTWFVLQHWLQILTRGLEHAHLLKQGKSADSMAVMQDRDKANRAPMTKLQAAMQSKPNKAHEDDTFHSSEDAASAGRCAQAPACTHPRPAEG
jgi:hypothetical protein